MRPDNSEEINRLRERYFSILEKIEAEVPFLVKSTYNLGRPSFLGICSTACVAIDKISNDLLYDWDPNFFKKLDDKEVCFVLLHETLHLLLNHIGKTKVDLDREKWNIACDIVINDYLINDLMRKSAVIKKLIKPPNGIVTGMDILNDNYSLQKYSAEKVYLKLQTFLKSETFEYENIDNHESWDEITEQNIEKIGEFVSQNKDIEEAIKKGILPGSLPGLFKEFVKKRKNNFSLKKIIKHIISEKTEEKYIENWRRYNIKLSSIYPKVILPYICLNEKQGKLSILFALDVSGSMSSKLISELIAIAKNHTADNDVTAIQFDVNVRPLNLEKREIIGRGGTSFESVVQFVKKSKQNYDVIIVLTDGFGGDITTKDIDPKRWFWGLTTNYSLPKSYGTVFRIPPEYIKY